jgi:hypothetical protein
LNNGVEAAAHDLLIGIQLRRPELRSVLVTGVECRGAKVVAEALAAVAATSLQRNVVTIHVGEGAGDTVTVTGSNGLGLESSSRLADVGFVRSAIQAATSKSFVIASTSDFLNELDSRVLAATVDGVVLLAREGRSRERSLREARVRLASAGATLLGAVYARTALD